MKIGIIITHPTQFDVPIFRLGNDIIEVIYTNGSLVKNMFDPEIGKTLTWRENNLEGYNYELVPETGGLIWLYRKLKRQKYDLIIVNGYYNKYFKFSIFFGKFFACKTALRLDTVQFNNTSLARTISKKVIYFGLRQFVDVFFVVGSLSKKFLINLGIDKEKISYYGYISDSDYFEKASKLDQQQKQDLKTLSGIPDNKKIILCVSKHSEREAPFDTLNAFKRLNDANLHLVLIGDGPLHEKVKSEVRRLGIKNISLLGYIHFTELPLYYSISDLFVHDSHNEPWGVSVQEAIACGLPVIASDKVGAAFDLIKEGENGYIFEAGNEEDIANKINLSLNLDKTKLREANLLVLNDWNYTRTLQNIIERV